MNERMQIGAVQVGLLVPGGRRQDDVGVQRRRIHAEVQIDDQVHLSDGRDIVPLDFFGVLLGVLAIAFECVPR